MEHHGIAETTAQKKFIPVKEFAAKYDMSVQNVYSRIRRGTLKGKKIGSYQLVQEK